ncbi:MAG: T9SS type A sorting domain-containing protein, partial [Saprospiraceae bacterium]
ANYSKNITVADLSELRKLLLRINTAFPNGNDPWMCIPKDTVITNTSYPYTVAKYQSVTLTKTYKDSVHFIAIKKGDINNSYINDNHQSLQSRQSKYQTVSVVNSTKNGITYLNFSFEKDLNLDGFQIFINGLEISENYKIESVFDDLEYNIDDTAFLCIAHNKKPIEIKAGNVFLSIPVTHKVLGLNLDSESEIYMNLRSYKLQPILRNSKIGHFTLVNTLVNNNQIQLRCSVDNCPASYSIYNSTGKIVTFGNIDSAGYDDVSEISIPIIPSGIYALKLEYDGIVQSELFVVP